MRLLICAGGTGGGVYPALSVLQNASDKVTEVLWVGVEDGMEYHLVKRQGIRFKTIPAAGVHGIALSKLPGNLLKLARGVLASLQILREFNPDVLFFTGGYMAVPMALAGWNYPKLLYVPDIEPGLALKTLARFANQIVVTAEESLQFFPSSKHVTVSGYPTRQDTTSWEHNAALKYFGFRDDIPVLLVTGGSKGARSINQAVLAHRSALLEKVQLIHITGSLDWPETEESLAALSDRQKGRYFTSEYLHEEMGAALAAADLVLSRSGASCLGEYPQFGLPAILVPYPHAWRYQKVNADYLVNNNAAVMIKDDHLKDELLATVQRLLETPGKLETMRKAMRSLQKPHAARKITAQLAELAGESK
ncbi:MAG: undecaprenyldiphospho-muramoylpentapeptide beta-N-acetylglucosaminyltransferase [Anaerolineales bacterium]|nr:undecaprenyldiphospho-muramoylpentapeptide beta-N-acetylglucosaminyltransferase [Anaerolineales bacterium]